MSGMGGFSFYSLPFRGRRIIKTSSSAAGKGGKRGGAKRCMASSHAKEEPHYRYMTPFACDCASDRAVTQLRFPPSANDAESPLFPCSVIVFSSTALFFHCYQGEESNSENSPLDRRAEGLRHRLTLNLPLLKLGSPKCMQGQFRILLWADRRRPPPPALLPPWEENRFRN